MKKALALVLALAMVLVLVACGAEAPAKEEEVYTLHHYWYKELRKKGKIERSKYEDVYKPLD